MKFKLRTTILIVAVFAVSFASFYFFAGYASGDLKGASFLISPPAGSFPVGSTFTVTVAIDTANQTINAFHTRIKFPPDKLQVVSSGVRKSITGFWVGRPVFSNKEGFIELEGAIPNPGISTDFGILTEIIFRVKSIGQATVSFDNDSTLYLHDGNGTELGVSFQNGLYNLVLPPPAGPLVVSSTHPDQNKWYNANDVILRWNNQSGVGGYSYVLSKNPIDLPDKISEGINNEVIYRSIENDIHYFHIRALRGGAWGGVTHYGLKIQTSTPAKFKIDVEPKRRTSSKVVILSFDTSDPLSGIDYYEAKVIPLQPPDGKDEITDNLLFFEIKTPYVLQFEDFGSYQIIIRAYNKAGNYVEATEKIKIVKPIFEFVERGGLRIGDKVVIPWYIALIVSLVLLGALAYLARHIFKWHIKIDKEHRGGALKDSEVFGKLKELQEKLRSSKKVIVAILISTALFGALYLSSYQAEAQEAQLPPPVINLVSRNISNNEIFYIGGRAASGKGSTVIIYLQSLSSGETFKFEKAVSENGEWFHSNSKFLQSGNYLLWTQLKIGDNMSPPSSQVQMIISPTAIQLGASRISYETLYLIILIVFALLALGLIIFIVYHFRHGRIKHKSLIREIREAEESIKRGFAVLRRDIEVELEIIKKAKMSKEVSIEEKRREKQLLKDLNEIQENIGKEVWDIEKRLEKGSEVD